MVGDFFKEQRLVKKVVLSEFVKKKDFLICVDSDGCAMDTMDIKHIRCFGPCMVDEWNLHGWETPILTRWNDINLYTMTRGINRFKGLAKMLREIHEEYTEIEEIEVLENWVENSDELSNAALQRAIDETGSICLKKALEWSVQVNASIDRLEESDKKPFTGVKKALEYAHEYADIAIVSSANAKAVLDEWELYGLLDHVDIVLAQDAGSKAYCIGELMKKGYEKEKVMMTGDAPGDRDAAVKNGVYYYPILVRREKESWEEFVAEAVKRLVDGSFGGAYQKEKIRKFEENLK